MDTESALVISNISKRYRLGEREAKADSLMAALRKGVGAPLRNLRRLRGLSVGASEDDGDSVLWALRDINLSVNRGEVVGIIGRNGAGKSTLLKVISRITVPTSGRIEVFGRVSSLLEVGTGFHPELTGRENIFLNGSILGMSKREIEASFDEIVEFSGVGRFLDTPVKRYSSGMYVRLAFSVAAHLEPDILIIDEVLAVGDAEFQAKCLGRMGEVSEKDGRTVLFVSHNMSAVRSLCPRCVWIDGGGVVMDGPSEQVVEAYLRKVAQGGREFLRMTNHEGTFEITGVDLTEKPRSRGREVDPDGIPVIGYGRGLTIDIHYSAAEPVERPYFWVAIKGMHGTLMSASMLLDGACPPVLDGEGSLRVTFPKLLLMPAQTYTVTLAMREADAVTPIIRTADVASFSVVGEPADVDAHGPLAGNFLHRSTSVVVPYTWTLPDGSEHAVSPGGRKGGKRKAS